ncbi:MAG: HNH endonuclease [Sphaerospermopsis kisseleviana]
MPIPKSLYEQVRQRAQCRCEYCHYHELFSTAPLSIDHLQPQSLGGTDSPDNLALACRRCNERRYNFTTGIDPNTGKETPLFNPRQQIWSEHFIWTSDGLCIIGTTPTGRATCERLDLNDERRGEKFIQKSRQRWVESGLHPPEDDPQESE